MIHPLHTCNEVLLIDGEQLAQLMIDFDLGVSPVAQYEIKRLDVNYIEDVCLPSIFTCLGCVPSDRGG